ncbi:MAG: ABC transporter ATP-binding protein [Acidimicrobiia bacterium]|nr:ABC transporter ATP-binding protein [Acidimicrobiia bacterium]
MEPASHIRAAEHHGAALALEPAGGGCIPLNWELVIETRGLSKAYKGVAALTDLDLRVPKNSIFGFLGPNGAGKTTAIKLLLGLVRPTSGSGSMFGLDIDKDSIEIRRRIGFLAQDPSFYEYMTARETLRFKARFYYRGPKADIESRIAETLELVGLSDKADRPVRGYSGGERQRLGIAQAQVNHPDLLILDEPAASLDPMGRRDVLEVMERLRRHATVFYSTHILDDVQRVSDSVAILNRGRLVAQAPISQLLEGSGGTVYALSIEGDTTEAEARVLEQPWVSGLQSLPVDGSTTWEVTVRDEAAATTHLLRLVLADRQLNVTSFGPKKYELEEIFLDIVEGGEHGRGAGPASS